MERYPDTWHQRQGGQHAAVSYFKYGTVDCAFVGLKMGTLGCHTQPHLKEGMASIYRWLLEGGFGEWARWFAERCVQDAPVKAPAEVSKADVRRQVSAYSLSFEPHLQMYVCTFTYSTCNPIIFENLTYSTLTLLNLNAFSL